MDQHIGVLAFPFTSHPQTLLGLVRRLAFAAPHTKFSFFSTANSNAFLFSTQSADGLNNVKPYDVADGVPEGHVLSGNPEEAVGFFLKGAVGNFRQAMEVAVADTARKISCLVTDAFLWFGADMAEEMGVPWVPFWIAGLSALSVHFHTDAIRQKIGLNGHEDQTLDFIPGLSAMRVRDLPEGIVSGDLDSAPSRMLHKMGLLLPRATAVIANSVEELNPIVATDLKSKLPKLLCLAPPTPSSQPASNPDTSSCLSWLDKQKAKTVAYISFGSILSPSPDELVALTEALEATGVPFLWSIKDNAKKNLPKGFLEMTSGKGKVVPWAPQMQVLKHPSVGVHVTHSGWNSVMESIAGEVPMICRPFFADNSLNCRAVEDVWGIGVGIEGGVFTKSGLVRKKMREKIGVLKELCRKADEPNGSSSQNFNTLLELVTKFQMDSSAN
ncbi:hypothetical protein AAG906_006104 [Vitis piasezkii]